MTMIDDDVREDAGRWAADLIAQFDAVQVRADHNAIVDVKENRDRITWLRKNGARLDDAMKASWDRTEEPIVPVRLVPLPDLDQPRTPVNETELVLAGAKAAVDAIGNLLAGHRDCATYPDGDTIPRSEPEDFWQFSVDVMMKSLVNATIETGQSASLALDDILIAFTNAYRDQAEASQGIGGRGRLPDWRCAPADKRLN